MTTNQYNLLLLLAQIELDRLSDQHDGGIQTVKNHGELQSAIQSCEMEEDKDLTEPPRQQSYRITLNGKKKFVDQARLNYEEIVTLAGKPLNEGLVYTISFAHCAGEFQQGTLTPGGHQCHLKDGAVIDCVVTNNG